MSNIPRWESLRERVNKLWGSLSAAEQTWLKYYMEKHWRYVYSWRKKRPKRVRPTLLPRKKYPKCRLSVQSSFSLVPVLYMLLQSEKKRKNEWVVGLQSKVLFIFWTHVWAAPIRQNNTCDCVTARTLGSKQDCPDCQDTKIIRCFLYLF